MERDQGSEQHPPPDRGTTRHGPGPERDAAPEPDAGPTRDTTPTRDPASEPDTAQAPGLAPRPSSAREAAQPHRTPPHPAPAPAGDSESTAPDGDADVAGEAGADDAATRPLALLMHAAFFLLLGASLARFLLRHPGEARTPWIIGLSIALAVLYVVGPVLGSRPTARSLVWLGGLVLVWMVVVVLAPSFAWCAVPLFYTGLRILPARAAYVLVALLTLFVVAAQLRLAHGFDPNLVLAPPAVAAVATAVFVHMRRQAVQQGRLIDDLLRTRRELAATERREGTLAERQRLSMEIHDSLAQGLSSQQMLLQAADRTWDTDPAAARRHIRTAEGIAERNLAEARRFVHDLAPADLAEGGGLDAALHALAARETAQAQGRLTVRCHIEGAPPTALPDRTQSALLRIAQGALANVTEHAGATEAALTLTHLDDRTVLDIADNGHGFTPPATPETPRGVRGHGLPAMRARLHQLGGTLAIESAPGEGTVVTATLPVAPTPQDPA
ncbi:sensor histidine kinase [Streptomyces sp. NPDC019224]|uniref:sensor histidine kinase n=1 Tax=Streptomyces sp. NPDC019224 TaxID=3154484 RepID=UPI0033C0830D